MRRAIAAVAVAGAALGLSTAAPAQATPFSFIQALNSRGLYVTDANQALAWGYAICDTLNTYNGEVVTEAIYRMTDYTVPDRATAFIWVESAVEELCPWHDHRGRLPYAV